MNRIAYEADFNGWANDQAALLRGGRLGEADIANIAEEIGSMGRSEKRELVGRLAVLLTHLLKWRSQPAGRGYSWQASIKIQRRALQRHLDDSPSLRPFIPAALADAYEDAIIVAANETGLGEAALPKEAPWTWEEVMHPDFWPGDII